MHTPETIARMLNGSVRERRALALEVVEIMDRVVHYALRAGQYPLARHEDLVGEVLLYVFRDDAKVLRRWDPSRASLRGYLNMVGGRFVHRHLSGRPAPLELTEPASSGAPTDEQIAYQAALEEIFDWIRAHGSPKDRARFEVLLVEEYTPAEVAEQEGCSVEAIYTWLSRFKRRIKEGLPHLAEVLRRAE